MSLSLGPSVKLTVTAKSLLRGPTRRAMRSVTACCWVPAGVGLRTAWRAGKSKEKESNRERGSGRQKEKKIRKHHHQHHLGSRSSSARSVNDSSSIGIPVLRTASSLCDGCVKPVSDVLTPPPLWSASPSLSWHNGLINISL